MTKITKKSRSYLYLLSVLIGITMLMPLLESRRVLFNNMIAVGFFFFFLITAVKALTTRGIAPKSHFVIWAIRITTGLAFITDISHAVLQDLMEQGEMISAGAGSLAQMPQSAWWLQSMYFISLFGYSTVIAILIIFIIKDLFSGERVTSDKLFGAITVYFLLGVLWTTLYQIVEVIQPGSLLWSSGEHLMNYYQVQYFSFTTLCTLGYGDIVPTTKLTMALSNLEAIIGALYLAILVARLVGLYTAQASRDKLDEAKREAKKEMAQVREEYQALEKEIKKR